MPALDTRVVLLCNFPRILFPVRDPHIQSAEALASASSRLDGNRYRSWEVYVVRSRLICFSCTCRSREVPSFPLNCPLASLSRCRVQHTTVHINRLPTLADTDCGRLANLAAYARMAVGSPLASRGRISSVLICCGCVISTCIATKG